MEIIIEHGGMLTTIQDLGRQRYRRFGLPAAGVMDSYAFQAANIMVGNEGNPAALELTLLGPIIRFEGSGMMALTGADLGAKLNDQPLPPWQSVVIEKGDRLTFSGPVKGCRAYLAFRGGLAVPSVMESQSTYIKGRLGGLEGRALQSGDVIATAAQNSKSVRPGCIGPMWIPTHTEDVNVRVVMGPQDDYFTEESICAFLQDKYQVSNEADRMGYRLVGTKLVHSKATEIVSDGVLPGAIQVPGDGQLIVLLADAQTTGGYPKIATVIDIDLSKLAQLKPGDSLQFQAVSSHEAVELLRDRQQKLVELREWLSRQQAHPLKTYHMRSAGQSLRVSIQEVE